MLQDSPQAGVLNVSCQMLFVKLANLIYRRDAHRDKFASRSTQILCLSSKEFS